MPENFEAWRLYQILQSQQNLAFGAKCGALWYPSVDFVFRLYGVKKRKDTFEKLLFVHDVYMKKKAKEKD